MEGISTNDILKKYDPHQYTDTNRNNHTTSTKCQYQIAASYPKWWVVVKWKLINRPRQMIRNVVPIITCNPWNPVATKNSDPYTLSEIVNGVSMYSDSCRAVKYTPSAIVIIRAYVDSFLLPFIKAWCDHVTVTPDANSTAVFSRGTSNGLSGSTPVGGHSAPNSGAGTRLTWYRVQKNPKKKNTSDTMNSIIPYRMFFCTPFVWCP